MISSVVNAPVSFAFGYWTKNYNPFTCSTNDKVVLGEPEENRNHNIACALCIIPILGSMIAGVIRIAFAVKEYRFTDDFNAGDKVILKAEIVRGSIELLGIGFLFVIPDLLLTLGRRCFEKQS